MVVMKDEFSPSSKGKTLQTNAVVIITHDANDAATIARESLPTPWRKWYVWQHARALVRRCARAPTSHARGGVDRVRGSSVFLVLFHARVSCDSTDAASATRRRRS